MSRGSVTLGGGAYMPPLLFLIEWGYIDQTRYTYTLTSNTIFENIFFADVSIFAPGGQKGHKMG